MRTLCRSAIAFVLGVVPSALACTGASSSPGTSDAGSQPTLEAGGLAADAYSPETGPGDGGAPPPDAPTSSPDAGTDAGDSGPASGTFTVSSGQIFGPAGQPFKALGIAVFDFDMANAVTSASGDPLVSLFPGMNIVRLACSSAGTGDYSADSVSALQTFVDEVTALHIVVEIEDHNGADAVYSGTQLTTETGWYASVASAFANNPYVWFGTMNEPGAGDSAQELAIYQAIRGAGNGSPILLELTGGGSSDPTTGLTTSDYATMTNVVWDVHFYDWIAGYSADQSTVSAALAGEISAIQTIQSAEGTIPVIVGEYGNSTEGTSVDPGGSEVVTAVATSGVGNVAWNWNCACSDGSDADGLTDDHDHLTAYGQQVAEYIAAGQ